MRTVEFVSSKKSYQTVTIETDVKTKGELVTVLEEKGFDVSNQKFIEKDTETTLESPDAKLPEGDFTLFATPTKNDSGAGSNSLIQAHIQIFYIMDEISNSGEIDADEIDTAIEHLQEAKKQDLSSSRSARLYKTYGEALERKLKQ